MDILKTNIEELAISRQASAASSRRPSRTHSRYNSTAPTPRRHHSPRRDLTKANLKKVKQVLEVTAQEKDDSDDDGEAFHGFPADTVPVKIGTVVTASTLPLWLNAQKAASQSPPSGNSPILSLSSLKTKANRATYEDIPKLNHADRLSFQDYLAQVRTFMVKNNISPQLVVEIVKSKVYQKLQLALSQAVQNMKLKTEEDLLQICMATIYMGFSQDTLKNNFITINATRIASNVDISLVFQDIITSQAPALVNLSKKANGCAPDARALLTHSYARELLFKCIPQTHQQVLGVQGILQTDDLAEIVAAVARIKLYSPGTATVNQMTLAPAITMLGAGAPSATPPASAKPPPTADAQVSALKRQLLSCQKELSALKQSGIGNKSQATANKPQDKPYNVQRFQCAFCQQLPTDAPCRHCRKHSTLTQQFLYKTCSVCEAFRQQQSLAATALAPPESSPQ